MGIYGLYIVFITLGVLNIVTGFFVDGTMQASLSGREELIRQAAERKEQIAGMARDVFCVLDADGSGTLSKEELEACMCDETLEECLALLEIDERQAKVLFDIIAVDGDEVPIDDFVDGVSKMTAPIKGVDVFSILNQ